MSLGTLCTTVEGGIVFLFFFRRSFLLEVLFSKQEDLCLFCNSPSTKQGASVAGVSLRNFRFEQRTSMALKSLPSFFPSGVERPKNPYSRRFQVPNSKFSLLYFGPRGASREYNQSSSLPVPSTSHHYLEANFLKRRNVRWQGGSE